MPEFFICQNRIVQPADIQWLQSWIIDHPSWSRYRLACELCRLWDWSSPTGQIKDFAARSFLLKLATRGLITLPPVRESKQRVRGYARPIPASFVEPKQPSSVVSSLAELTPLSLNIPESGSFEEHLFDHYLANHHYPGFQRTAGENLKRAANWKLIGKTTGRSRQDRYSNMIVPVKDIYLYPLTSRFRESLCHEDCR